MQSYTIVDQFGTGVPRTPRLDPYTRESQVRPRRAAASGIQELRISSRCARTSLAGTTTIAPEPASFTPDLTLDMKVVQGLDGSFYLTVPALAPSVAKVRLTWEAWPEPYYLDVPASSIIGGYYQIPDDEMEAHLSDILWAQAITATGPFGKRVAVKAFGTPGVAEEANSTRHVGFVNASGHINENLQFLLRAATVSRPFSYVYGDPTHDSWQLDSPEYYLARPATSNG